MQQTNFLNRFRIKIGVLATGSVVMAGYTIGVFVPKIAQATEARLFRWESVEIVCSGERAGTSIRFSGS